MMSLFPSLLCFLSQINTTLSLIIDFEPSFIGGVESQFIQIFRNGCAVIGPTHGKIFNEIVGALHSSSICL